MSAKPLSLSLLKQLLRLQSQGRGIKEIARQTGNSCNTVRKYLHLADSSDCSLEVLLAQPEGELEARLMRSQPVQSSEYQVLEANKEYIQCYVIYTTKKTYTEESIRPAKEN